MIEKIKEKIKQGWEWTVDKAKRFWKWIVGGIVIATLAAPVLTPDYPVEYVTAPENNRYTIGRRNFQTEFKQNIKEDGSLQYKLGDKYLAMTPVALRIDGKDIKLPQDSIGDGISLYEDAFGDGIDVGVLLGSRIWKKTVTFGSLEKIGTIVSGVEFLEVVFEIDTNFVIDGWDKNSYFEIDDTVRLGDYSYWHPAYAWDSSQEEVCEEQCEDSCDEGCTDDRLCDVCDPCGEICYTENNRIKLTSYLERRDDQLLYVKKIPIDWIKSATFPIYTDADVSYGVEVAFGGAGWDRNVDIAAVNTNEFVACYVDELVANDPVFCAAGSVTGTSTLSMGATTTLGLDGGLNAAFDSLSVCKLEDSTFAVYSVSDILDDDGYMRVGTTSGTDLTWGINLTEFLNSDYESGGCAQLGDNKNVICYNDETGGDNAMCMIATSTAGTSTVTFGTPVQGTSTQQFYHAPIDMVDTDKFAVLWNLNQATTSIWVQVATTSDGDITFGTEQVVSDWEAKLLAGSHSFNIVSPDTDKLYFAYVYTTAPAGCWARAGTVDGTVVTLGAETYVDVLCTSGNELSELVAPDTTHALLAAAPWNAGGAGEEYGTTYLTTIDWGDVTVATDTSDTFNAASTGGGSTSRGLDIDLIDDNLVAICYTDIDAALQAQCIIGDIEALGLVLTTDAPTNLGSTTVDMNLTLDIKQAAEADLWFDYGTTSDPTVTVSSFASTGINTVTASTSWATTVALTTFNIYDYRARATSSEGDDKTGDLAGIFYSADVSDMNYTLTHLDEGTFSTTTTTTDPTIILEDLGGESLEDEESFETDDGDWVDQSCVGCTNECWMRGNTTGSAGTGPATNHGAEGSNYFQFLESSSGYCYDSGDKDYIEYTATGTFNYIDFYYHMYGATMDILAIDSYYGAAWNEEWSMENQQHAAEGSAWTRASTTIEPTATKIRFRGERNTTGYTSDMAFDVVRIYVGGTDYATTGEHIDVALDIDDITAYDDSMIVWDSTVPASTTFSVYTEASNSSITAPTSGWNLATSGEAMADLSGDLSGQYLWVKQVLETASSSATPALNWIIYGINTGEAAAPGVRRIIPAY